MPSPDTNGPAKVGLRPAGVAVRLLASAALLVALIEVALRLWPSLVPAKALIFFEPELRSRIARGRFPTRADTYLLPRDDGGNPIRLFKPYTVRPYGYEPCPSARSVATDEIGFGNPPGFFTASPHIAIMAVGDSFTWPTGVDPLDAWPARLGRQLGVSSYNLGREGTGPYEHLQILKRFGLEKTPRVVILNIYEGNDLRDITQHVAYRDELAPNTMKATALKTSALWRHSRCWNLIMGSWTYVRDNRHRNRTEGTVDYQYQVGSAASGITFNEQQSDRDEVVYARRQQAGNVGFEGFDLPLRTLRDLALHHGFIPVVTYTPTAATVYAPVLFEDPANRAVLAAFSRDQRQYIHDRAGEMGILMIDLTAALSQTAALAAPSLDNLLYYPNSLHLTPRGHELVATLLFARLSAILSPAAPAL